MTMSRRRGSHGTAASRMTLCCAGRAASATTRSRRARLRAYFVRSPHGFARIEHIDTAAAEKRAGRGRGLHRRRSGRRRTTTRSRIRIRFPAAAASCRSRRTGRRWPANACMHIGEPVAMVVASSAAAAQDAAEKVAVDYQPLDGRHRRARSGQARRAAALAGGARQCRLRLDRAGRSRRQEAGCARARLQGRPRMWCASNGQPAPGGRLARAAHGERELRRRQASASPCAAGRKASPPCAVRSRRHERQAGGHARDHRGCRRRLRHEGLPAIRNTSRCCMPRARCKRPIHWVSTRSEAFVSDNQGRDSFWRAQLALNARGRFLALRVDCHRQYRRLHHRRRAFHHDRCISPAACRRSTTSRWRR